MKKTLIAALVGFLLGTATVGAQVSSHFAAANGDQGNPSYSFLNDPTTGIFNSGSGQVSVTSGNSLVGTFKSTGLNIPGALTVTGTQTFTGAATFGTLTATILNTTNLNVTGLILNANGTNGAPTYAFTGATDGGLYNQSGIGPSIAAGGVRGLSVRGTGNVDIVSGSLTFGVATSKILPGATSISLRNNADTQSNLLVADNGDVTFFRRMLAGGGTCVDPCYSFGSASGAGMTLTGVGTDVTIRAGSATNRLVVSDSPVGIVVIGAISATGTSSTITSSGATSGIGYATGAGGTQTQATSKATGVTLNTITGQITMNGAALAADTTVAFTLTDSAIAATDHVMVNHKSVGTLGAYSFAVAPAGGSAVISVHNLTPGSLSEAIVIQFTVIKAVTS